MAVLYFFVGAFSVRNLLELLCSAAEDAVGNLLLNCICFWKNGLGVVFLIFFNLIIKCAY